MKSKQVTKESFEDLDRLAHDTSDIRPLSEPLRREWEAARRTGIKVGRGRPRKSPEHKSRIVPISIDPTLLAKIDKFAKSAGLSRSRLVAEGLLLRMKSKSE